MIAADSEVVLHHDTAGLKQKKVDELNEAVRAVEKAIDTEKTEIIQWVKTYDGTRKELRNGLRMRFMDLEDKLNSVSAKLMSIRDNVQLGSISENLQFFNDFAKLPLVQVPNSITLETVVLQLRDKYLHEMPVALTTRVKDHPDKINLT